MRVRFGLVNKHSVGLFAAALVIGILVSGGGRLVLNRWFAAGAAIAAAFTTPDIWWQAQHQWATIAMTRALAQENGGLGNNIASWVIEQLIMAALPMVAVWVAGLRFLWRSSRPLWRALAWAYAILFVLFALTTGGKIYYLAGAYIYLLAAGAVAIDGWLAAAIATAAAAPLTLPVLPAAEVGWTQKVNPVLAGRTQPRACWCPGGTSRRGTNIRIGGQDHPVLRTW